MPDQEQSLAIAEAIPVALSVDFTFLGSSQMHLHTQARASFRLPTESLLLRPISLRVSGWQLLIKSSDKFTNIFVFVFFFFLRWKEPAEISHCAFICTELYRLSKDRHTTSSTAASCKIQGLRIFWIIPKGSALLCCKFLCLYFLVHL